MSYLVPIAALILYLFIANQVGPKIGGDQKTSSQSQQQEEKVRSEKVEKQNEAEPLKSGSQ